MGKDKKNFINKIFYHRKAIILFNIVQISECDGEFATNAGKII